MIKEGIYVSTLTVIILFGIMMIMGCLMAQIEKWNNRYIQKAFGWGGIILTGCIGTILHELSHLIMCLIFRHKVKQVKLFRPIQSKKDGVLGYVNHSFNPSSTYQKVGNFFISTHMSLSKEDLKGAWSGGVLLAVLLWIFEMAFYYYNSSLCLVISWKLALYLGLFLGMGILFALITLCLSLIIYSLKRLIQI